jgi:DNA-binding response OmpR family regulator/anti-sigma regulatory factor (Ser/Thr protein kinase)
MKEKILIVDDDKYITLLLYNFLDDEGYVCETAEDGLEALERVRKGNTYDMVLLDFVMPRMNGLEFLAAVRDIDPKLPVMMISGYRTRENTLEALKLGAIGFIKKPFSLKEVLKNMRLVLQASKSKKALGPIIPFLKKGSMEFVFKTRAVEPDKISLYLATHLGEMGFIEGHRISTVALAFNEVITNAVEHGNLELPVNYFLENPGGETTEMVAEEGIERLRSTQYADRNLTIRYQCENDETRVSVTDEGPGFDVDSVLEFIACRDDSAAADHIGRGLILIKYAVDEVLFNDRGNEVTLVIRSQPQA